MGASTFMQVGRGKTAAEAFKSARDEAAYEHGHGGYSGSLAEKRNFVMIPVPAGIDPRVVARKLVDEGDPRVDDKWGPAGCIALGKGEWLFFGWASS